jgi:hypothetical protein
MGSAASEAQIRNPALLQIVARRVDMTPRRRGWKRSQARMSAFPRRYPKMRNPIFKQAVIVGAGMAGLAAAKAIAPQFEKVTVFDRDSLPDASAAATISLTASRAG